MIYVNYGCGLCAPEGWRNYDGSPRLFLENAPIISQILGLWQDRLFPKNVKYGDIVKGLPLTPSIADAVYSSHVLEHLSRQDIEYALINTYRLLRPGGVFRLIVPDIEWRATRYLREREKNPTEAADKFIESCNIGTRRSARGLVGKLRAAYGHSGHNWMYDFGSLSALLKKTGFVNIRRCSMGDAGDPMFDAVEAKDRFFEMGYQELAIQSRRPE
jgi:SAM-dependent methyltransferase